MPDRKVTNPKFTPVTEDARTKGRFAANRGTGERGTQKIRVTEGPIKDTQPPDVAEDAEEPKKKRRRK